MGCSPSKRRLFTSASEPIHSQKALIQEPTESRDSQSNEERQVGKTAFTAQLETVSENKQDGLPALVPPQESQPTASSECAQENKPEIQKRTQVDPLPQKQHEKTEWRWAGKDKGGRESDGVEKISSSLSKKPLADAAMKKACQLVTGQTGSHVSKYEALRELLDQAVQTHLSLQPMATFMAQRYEEINRELEEMAEEWERMLREQEDHLEWPKPGSADPPPEPLQHMFQYASSKMKLGAESTEDLGDSVLEEAVDYFTSFSALLEERLRAKRAAEKRLAQVLARIGVMGLPGKRGPEDGSLHSEDSGIGAESESLNGFDRYQRHRDSCDSTRSEINNFESSHHKSNDTGHTESLIRAKQIDTFGKDESLWVEKGTEQQPKLAQTAAFTWAEKVPSTVTAQRRSQSADSIHNQTEEFTLIKPEGTQSNHNQQMHHTSQNETHQESKGLSASKNGEDEWHPSHHAHSPHLPIQQRTHHPARPRLRRHSSGELKPHENGNEGEGEDMKVNTGALGTTIPPARPSSSAAQTTPVVHGGRNSVKRLINTFTNRENTVQSEHPSNGPVHFRRSRKDCVSVTSKTESRKSHFTNIINKHEDQNSDTLPPPPPEVLMDKSFSQTEGPHGAEGGDHTHAQGHPTSWHLRSSLRTVPLLPNRCTVHHSSSSSTLDNSPGHSVQRDTTADCRDRPEGLQELEQDKEKEKAPSLLNQTCKTIHDSRESPLKATARTHLLPPSPLQNHGLPNLSVIQQTGTPSEDGSSVPCHLPPLPSCQKGIVNLSNSQMIPPAASSAKPNENPKKTQEESPKVEILPAHVQTFSETESQYGAVTYTTSSSSTLPPHWGQSPRSKLHLSAWSPQPFVRRTLSERRPASNAPVRTFLTAGSTVSQNQASVCTISQRVEDGPTSEEERQHA